MLSKMNWVGGCLMLCAAGVQADGVTQLNAFVKEVRSAKAQFTQVVTAPGGAKKKTSSGTFEFQRPNRFRFIYTQPFEQAIVSDGRQVWVHDVDLNQVSSRPLRQALNGTPAALLAGGDLSKDFVLSAVPAAAASDGLSWVQALPKVKDGAYQSIKVGFQGQNLAAIEILDNLGQLSRLTFTQMVVNPTLPANNFRFVPPKGADVIQP
jgi:outer membrane lipoprotein carrier protein